MSDDEDGKAERHGRRAKKRTVWWLQREAWQIAEDSGFHGDETTMDDDRSRAKILALIHSEVSEALEADRNGAGTGEYAEELADIVIRVFDHATSEDIDLEGAILVKMDENREREHKHGKRY